MHPVLFFESFFSCSRDDLECLQPLSRSLLNMIVNGSNVLPLRPIERVEMDCDADNKVLIFVKKDAKLQAHDYEASVHDGDFAETFRHLQHTCIKYFSVMVRDSPFLRYWKTQETACFTVVSVDIDLPKTVDYDVLDSIVNRLRPKTTERCIMWPENDDNGEMLVLLARDSFLNNLQTCRLMVGENAFPPPTFFLNERGYPNYEVSCYDGNAADVIDGLIESFVRDGCANTRLESVYIWWVVWADEPPPAPKQLSKSTKIDLPLPAIDLTSSLTPDDHGASRCEMYSFTNKAQGKRMEVYKWSVEMGFRFVRHTTHVLQCRVKNL